MRETLVDLLVDLEAGMAATYECAASARTGTDPEEGRLLRRILVPLAKLRTTRVALGAASAALEIFGGNGYMEDWPMARRFAARRLAEHPVRGLLDDDRTALDLFEPITRYGPLDPADLPA